MKDKFNVVVFEDKAGTRYLYCDSAIAAISGPGEDDKTIAEFSSAERDRLKALNAELAEALEDLTDIIENAGLLNLTNGVQLGQTSWYVKASDRMQQARAALAKNKGETQC